MGMGGLMVRKTLTEIGNRLRPVLRWLAAHSRIILVIGAIALAGVSFFVGSWAERYDLANRLDRRVGDIILNLRGSMGDDSQQIEWQSAILNEVTLQWAIVQVGARSAGGGGIAEVNGHIVVASQMGRLSVLSPENRLYPLDANIPMGLEALRESALIEDPLFTIGSFRTYDLMAQQRADGQWRLFASFTRFGGENCMQFVVAAADVSASGDELEITSAWEDVYVARPGCIPYKDRGLRFVGQEGGGRIVAQDENTLLISVGHLQFDGYNDAREASQDMSWDLGKIIQLDLESRRSSPYAIGLRNPQGLVIMRDGRIIETEHGPQGGDEINIIRQGANYGWPLVSYGMAYAYPQRPWGAPGAIDGHDGYATPAFVFVPSIGISAVVQPDAIEFPMWADNNVLVASLRANSLYHVRIDGDCGVYAEQLFFEYRRLRDMISMSDGRVVILTDLGELIFVRNEARHENSDPFVVTGISTLSAPFPEEGESPDEPVLQRGRRIYQSVCAQCHSLDGEPGQGPPLNDVVGRQIGSSPNFGYSTALAGRDEEWTPARLESFLIDSSQDYEGTTMPNALVTWEDAPAVVAYLRTQNGEGGN